MKESVFLEICSEISDPDDPTGPERTRLRAEGTLSECAGTRILSYRETGESGATDCVVTERSDGVVTVLRRGASEACLIFEAGKEHLTVYTVAPYRFDAAVRTESVFSSHERDHGELSLRYRLIFGGAPRLCRLTLRYRKRGFSD